MIDDDHRGYLLELMTTKLLSLDTEQAIQIIAMSATLPVRPEQLDKLADLKADNVTEHGSHGSMDRWPLLRNQISTRAYS